MEERISLEELIEDLDEKKQAQDELIAELDELFADTNMLKDESDNFFNWGYGDKNMKVMFSVDNTSYAFKCYASSGDDDTGSNYSAKGPMSSAYDGAVKFLQAVEDMENDKAVDVEEDEVPDTDVDDDMEMPKFV